MDKYISFDPWWGGFNNVRMSYETAAAISVVTGRKLILPPAVYILFLSEHDDKSTFFDIWKIYDKDKFKEQFDTIEYDEIEEYKQFNSDTQYFDGIRHSNIVRSITFDDTYVNWGPMESPLSNHVLVATFNNRDGFEKFRNKRNVKFLNSYHKFIHFPRNLLCHFYYHVYSDDMKSLAKKIENGFQIRKEYHDKANNLMKGDFDAVHIRRNDFKWVRKDLTDDLYNNLEDYLENKVRKDVPLYIATDETDLNIFDFLRNKYNIVFLSDLVSDIPLHEELILDTLICSNAENFYGSHLSTFTDYINIQRKYKNKKDCSRQNLNNKREDITEETLPWLQEHYSWDKLWVNLY